MRKSFKAYKRPFKCYALPNARKSVRGRKAAGIARRAAKSGRVEQAYEKLVNATTVGFDGLEHHLTSPRKAAQLLADSILYEERRQHHRDYVAKKAVQGGGSRKRWAIYPISQSGQVGETPIQILGTKVAAEQRAADFSRWGKCDLTVLPYTPSK